MMICKTDSDQSLIINHTDFSLKIEDLPNEIILSIFSFLNEKKDCAILAVNRRWYVLGSRYVIPTLVHETNWLKFYCCLLKATHLHHYLNAEINLFAWPSAEANLKNALSIITKRKSIYSFAGLLKVKNLQSEVFKNLLLKLCEIDQSILLSQALRHPCIHSCHNLQSIFLQAICHNSLECVNLLLNDPRIDPSANDQIAIQQASYFGYAAIVHALLTNEKVDPSICTQTCIRTSSKEGHLEVVRRLLQDKRVDPSVYANMAYHDATRSGHHQVAKELFKDQRVKYVFYGWPCCKPKEEEEI